VISLRLFAQLEMKEIAVTLNKPEPAVRMLLHRGIRDLQNRINPSTQEKRS
jgi:DNA-directed RNA polymerase specialized sigma24 family protein